VAHTPDSAWCGADMVGLGGTGSKALWAEVQHQLFWGGADGGNRRMVRQGSTTLVSESGSKPDCRYRYISRNVAARTQAQPLQGTQSVW